MKLLRVAGLTIYFFIGILVPACDWTNLDDCNCGDYRYFNVENLEIQTFVQESEGLTVTPEQVLRLEQFDGFYLDYLVDYHACQTPMQDWSLHLMTPALACSCLTGFEGSKNEELVEFTVKTINDFDADHPAGSLIHDLLQYRGSFFMMDNQPFEDFLAEEQQGKLTVEDMRFNINRAPSLDSLLQVEVKMVLSTGESFEVLSTPFVLLP